MIKVIAMKGIPEGSAYLLPSDLAARVVQVSLLERLGLATNDDVRAVEEEIARRARECVKVTAAALPERKG